VGLKGLTEPIERKNPKVAALLSMYCDKVDMAPRGPAPPLERKFEKVDAEGMGETELAEILPAN
jgi:hypothetical protein